SPGTRKSSNSRSSSRRNEVSGARKGRAPFASRQFVTLRFGMDFSFQYCRRPIFSAGQRVPLESARRSIVPVFCDIIRLKVQRGLPEADVAAKEISGTAPSGARYDRTAL